MWLLEETPLDMWNDENMLALLLRLFTRLLEAMCEGKLLHYFNCELNILRDYPATLLEKAKIQLTRVLDDLPSFVTRDMIGDIKNFSDENFKKLVDRDRSIPQLVIPKMIPDGFLS